MFDTHRTKHSADAATSEEDRTSAALIAALQAQIDQLEQQLAEIEEQGLGVTPAAE